MLFQVSIVQEVSLCLIFIRGMKTESRYNLFVKTFTFLPFKVRGLSNSIDIQCTFSTLARVQLFSLEVKREFIQLLVGATNVSGSHTWIAFLSKGICIFFGGVTYLVLPTMFWELSFLLEWLVAYLTFVGLIPRVDSQMVDEVAFFIEGLITFSAN